MENLQTKTPRKRVANFTADEKALLAQLIKKRPIVESKITDGKSIIKKQAAWDFITQEFNCNANVYKRDTATVRRAWDNMKAFTRKSRAIERGNLFRTGGGPHAPPPPPQHGAIISMVEEAAPVMITEIKNAFDCDGTSLDAIDNSQELDFIENNTPTIPFVLIDNLDILDGEKNIDGNTVQDKYYEANGLQNENTKNSPDCTHTPLTRGQVRRPTDYIRREAVIRIFFLENRKKVEMQILKTQLEVEQINKKTALLEEERSKTLLEKSRIELEELKRSIIGKQSHPN